ncbi:transcriptional regulator [Kitasatospora herbaricolor]|uniref:helix-turn-helix domain-containing protein n=1 Tax=Kitasatospora herbaricolor TaxID=68217 RepID=UPI00174A688A|nr:helix-turn-helix transcriptional regulator [Kitasatospora herbaricolor]MDQ0309734.1 transcriptional regulator with XRE-family HTH domain [Kitasatospora herbaricolor]GGU99940.1 transcriptional regulator [Kitasatospora herbaricolor]
MDTPPELSDFLRTRRARLQPEDVGLVAYGARRRVPGLRREELAQLAGVSVTYYTRLEQGQSLNASDEVLDALARALRLSPDEHAHLRNIARPGRARPRPADRFERARAGTRQLIAAMREVPAVVVGHRNEVLAWNPLGHALLAGHLDPAAPDHRGERPNLSRMLFLDPHTRELYRRWEEEARANVAYLRLTAGRHPDDRELAALVGELSMNSPEFAALWARHPVNDCLFGSKELHHPVVGRLELAFEAMPMPEGGGHRMLLYSAEPGSASDAALRLLAGAAGAPGPDCGITVDGWELPGSSVNR